jgi:hypothetical protein
VLSGREPGSKTSSKATKTARNSTCSGLLTPGDRESGWENGAADEETHNPMKILGSCTHGKEHVQ